MDYVHDDGNAVPVRFVDQGLQLFGRAETRTGCEERTHMITEAAIIRMLLYRHNLNGVVSVLDDPRQHFLAELVVTAYFLSILCHTDMALVNQQGRSLGPEGLFLPDVWFLRSPYLCGEYLARLVLYDTLRPGRNPFAFSILPVYPHLIELSVLHRLARKGEFPVSCPFESMTQIGLLLLPVIEVTDKVNRRCIRCPFTEHPAIWCKVQAIVIMTVSEV